MKTSSPQFQALLKEPLSPRSHARDAFSKRFPNRIKDYMKRWPIFFNFLKRFFGSGHSPLNQYRQQKRINALIASVGPDAVILNLGSGTERVHPEIINVDLFDFKEVDLVADVTDMPLKDATVDAVLCDSVLEHVARASALLDEVVRILKPGGTLMASVPFMLPYHSSPDDFSRWTGQGLQHAIREHGFNIDACGIVGGPMGALQGILMHICATGLSFGSSAVYFALVHGCMILFSPLKLLDPFFMLFPYSIEAASNIFVVAKKI